MSVEAEEAKGGSADARDLGRIRQNFLATVENEKIAASKALVRDFGGEVPEDIEALVMLPGVGRKTANCVLVNAFDKPGIMVDTHCIRVSWRLGLHELNAPDKIEHALKDLFAPADWSTFSHRIIVHGRQVCKARNPLCEKCRLRRGCAYYQESADG